MSLQIMVIKTFESDSPGDEVQKLIESFFPSDEGVKMSEERQIGVVCIKNENTRFYFCNAEEVELDPYAYKKGKTYPLDQM